MNLTFLYLGFRLVVSSFGASFDLETRNIPHIFQGQVTCIEDGLLEGATHMG